MKPIYQGQIDIFCAPYAVINGIRHIRKTRLLACREMLHKAFLEFSRDEDAFRAALNQKTDYVDWVDKMLLWQRDSIVSMAPFSVSDEAEVFSFALWDVIESWLADGEQRAVLFQFVRFLLPAKLFDATTQNGSDTSSDTTAPQCVRHWTCGCQIADGAIQLYDSSLDPQGDADIVRSIPQSRLVSNEASLTENAICIIPHTVRLLRPRTIEIPRDFE